MPRNDVLRRIGGFGKKSKTASIAREDPLEEENKEMRPLIGTLKATYQMTPIGSNTLSQNGENWLIVARLSMVAQMADDIHAAL